MRVSLFVTLFCVFILSGQALAQNHEWVEIPTPTDVYLASSIDVNNIKRLPGGTVTYFEKTGYRIRKVEVNCEAKASRVLSETTPDRRDAYGNLVRGTPSKEPHPTLWRTIGDHTYHFATRACRSASRVTESVPKPTTTRRVVKRTRKGKS